jgi:toxin ParE1/3/4
MPRVVQTRRSRSDLVEILLYIRRDNHRAARRLLDTIHDKLQLLAEFPGLGQPREDLGRSLRSFPIGDYLLFYRPMKDGIQLVRVLHGRRDLRKLFRKK